MTNTKTATAVKTEYADLMTLDGEEFVFKAEAPLFIIFAEYLGYVSPFIKIAEEWCNGKPPKLIEQKVLIVEAKDILRQMKIDFDLDVIRDYYVAYYPIILKDYDEKLASIIEE
jgi:hypothetical protein